MLESCSCTRFYMPEGATCNSFYDKRLWSFEYLDTTGTGHVHTVFQVGSHMWVLKQCCIVATLSIATGLSASAQLGLTGQDPDWKPSREPSSPSCIA